MTDAAGVLEGAVACLTTTGVCANTVALNRVIPAQAGTIGRASVGVGLWIPTYAAITDLLNGVIGLRLARGASGMQRP